MKLLTGWLIGGAIAMAIVVPTNPSPAVSILIGLVCGSACVYGAYRLWPHG